MLPLLQSSFEIIIVLYLYLALGQDYINDFFIDLVYVVHKVESDLISRHILEITFLVKTLK